METRFVRAEMDVMKRFAAFISELLYIKDDLQKRLDMVEDGKQRLDSIIDDTAKLVKDLLNTTVDNQRRHFANCLSDYRIDLMPKLKPGSTNILMTRAQAKALVNLAQEKCKMCVDTPEEAEKCPVFKALEITALPDNYDSMLCPYSRAEWAD